MSNQTDPNYQPQYNQQQFHQPPAQQQQSHTTVVINQPGAQVKQRREWRTDKCACCDDMGICLGATFCPPCFGCWLAMEADETVCLALCCQGWVVPLRSFIRGKLGIQGSVCKDICAVACCNLCVACQVAREIKMAKSSGEWYTN